MDDKSFFLEKQLSTLDWKDYLELLPKFTNVFVYLPLDLVGILPELGKHHIDLMEGTMPAR